jgi:BASS family bile acid:Na+ symporter
MSLPDLLPLLALIAAGLALVIPSAALASHMDILLAALVLVTALDIDPRRLLGIGERARALLFLAIVPLLALGAGAWALAHLAHGPERDGTLALGLAPAEVASVGLIGLMGGASELAVAVLAVSMALSAAIGPPALVLLGHSSHGASAGPLIARFALVVIAPLAAGLWLRGALPGLARRERALSALSSLIVVALIFAALSATHAGLGTAVLVSLAFLAVSSLVAGAAVWGFGHRIDPSLVLTIGMRDFAVAAALAAAAFGDRAAQVAGVYGTLMLIAGATATSMARRRRRRP